MVPPVAARVWLYGVPTYPPGSDVVVINTPGLIVIDKAWVAVFGVGMALSVTFVEKLEEPAVVGVPEITPPELIVRPAGRLPELIVQP